MDTIKTIAGALVLILAAAANAGGGEITVDDFRSSPEQRWRFFADTVMGGRSAGQVEFKRSGGIAYARLTGTVSTANNGGFIQIRRQVRSTPNTAKGVRLIVRGNGERYFVHLRTSGTVLPWQYYQAGFATSGTWREVRLPFDGFASSGGLLRNVPKPASLRSVAIVAFGRDHQADVQVREIGFY
jgi:hypothetical protein